MAAGSCDSALEVSGSFAGSIPRRLLGHCLVVTVVPLVLLSMLAQPRPPGVLATGSTASAAVSQEQSRDLAVYLPRVHRQSSFRVSSVDGMVLAYVPAGAFIMGAALDEPEAQRHEKPRHEVYVDAFWIDRTEVTNRQFETFVRATGHAVEDRWWELAADKPEHPTVLMAWHDADAYCRWAGRSLPTEAQWEKAARGTDARPYPWGARSPADDLCTFGRDWSRRTTVVGSYSPDGDSPYGCADMAGNAWEWVADWFGHDYYAVSPRDNPTGPGPGPVDWRVLRGGSWDADAWQVRAACRWPYRGDLAGLDTGFRCAVAAR